MKYIVTGGAGFIGSHIVEELAQQQHEVVILDNLFSGKMENISPFLEKDNVSFVNGSITDLVLLQKTFEGADGIFHEGAIASVPRSIANPLATNEANVTGTLHVLIAARDCGVRKVVFASSSSVYGDTPTLPKREDMTPSPLSPYAVSKLAGEHYLRVFSEVYGLETVALRYFNVFGPRQDPKSQYAAVIPNFITRILNHQSPVIHGDGEQTRDFTFVKDVVQANIRAMEREAQGVFNVAYCRRISLKDLAAAIMEATGISVPLRYDPPRSGDVKDSLADITRARDAFGYEPQYTVKTGLKETIAWYQNQ
ncbi:SDR family oxidoreductase [Methanoregula sp.]|jgi:UDP-glucose 4-epimerase|uniref:SDR family oxidoreductase n=1 Tax=Methanoregula sp. TaxID=2052170 RepID=UPI0025F0AF43|nr:SDR family oxidoreductase [Methanoregula sp.]